MGSLTVIVVLCQNICVAPKPRLLSPQPCRRQGQGVKWPLVRLEWERIGT